MNLHNFRRQLKAAHHRSLCIISGSKAWQWQKIAQLYQPPETITWIGQTIPETLQTMGANNQYIAPERLKYHLGQEVDTAILDIEAGFNANQLGILSGMIKAGGLLILLVPNNEWWKLENSAIQRFLNTPLQPKDAFSHFYQHLHQTWQDSNCLWLSEQPHFEKAFTPQIPAGKTLIREDDFELTSEQQQALKKIHSVAFGHRKRPLVLSADRGRGKSSLLGIAAIEQLLEGKQHIVMTASRFDQVAKAFEQANKWLKNFLTTSKLQNTSQQIDLRQGEIIFTHQQQTKTLEFIAPDQLVLEPTTADVLMVDEAAFLPTPLLTELLKRHHRMVFATTLHGYEGSGRGFELRFKQSLNQLTPDWKNFHIHQPVRWADNDPLEIATNQALLLNANLSSAKPPKKFSLQSALEKGQLTIKNYTSQQLLAKPDQLKAMFTLLVQAHYQTSPNDLQHLLSAPNLRISACLFDNTPVAICLSIEEGGINSTNQQLQGHLVPQLVSRFYALPDFLTLKSWRIMRIAVHPEWQNQQIGSNLIQFVLAQAKTNKIDYVSGSFGVTPELFRFWQKLEFRALHIGNKRDKASGQHNLIVAKPMSALSQKYIATIQQTFEQQFPHLLMESLPYLAPQLVWQLLASFRLPLGFHQSKSVLEAFANQTQSYDALSGQLWKSSLTFGRTMQSLNHQQQGVWCDKILKKQNWQIVAHHYHLAGKKAVEKKLLETAKNILEALQNH
ncbi:GNAT family N-acetyltransferase [Thiomicrorhabdus indica]|uniref:GNAT family N-acetyltransferase n=1 Tax=Thiomicrorhabdus indica TaxID=2267253 RepID=UPI002AA73F34|nr:GNAT family N-acetyltransferase [Thiomicrorhabdus indica]